MKLIAIHDADGRIESVVVRPPNAPGATVSTSPGRTLTEVEAADLTFDPADDQSLQQLADKLKRYRVRRAGGAVSLVREE